MQKTITQYKPRPSAKAQQYPLITIKQTHAGKTYLA